MTELSVVEYICIHSHSIEMAGYAMMEVAAQTQNTMDIAGWGYF